MTCLQARCSPTGVRGFAFALGVVALFAITGCAAIVPKGASAIYDLSAPTAVPGGGRGNAQLLVPEPFTLKSLDTERIAARPTPANYAYLSGALWSDRLPKLLQARLVETFQNSGRVRAAAVPGQGLLIDYQVVLDVRAFEYTPSGAVAEFAVKLMDDRGGRVVAARTVREVIPLAGTDTASIVAGLDAAMDAAFVDIAGWVLQRV